LWRERVLASEKKRSESNLLYHERRYCSSEEMQAEQGSEKTMKSRCITIALLTVFVSSLFVQDAHAWGTRAQRAIVGMAMQKIQDDFPDTFRPDDASYLQDVLRGSVDGASGLSSDVPLGTDAETVAAVNSEIQLLRDARKLGPSSYFAYRMGVLSSLVANVMFPYGFAYTAEEIDLRAQIIADIDTRVERDFRGALGSAKREAVLDAEDYFKRHRLFRDGNRGIIRSDYARGVGFNGLMKESSLAYFEQSVDAVADVWSTVLISGALPHELPTSRPILAWYFVDEIGYLLGTRKNYYQADKAYANLDGLGAREADAYERVGDHYYGFGKSGGAERGVREWMISYTMDGAVRPRIADKLHDHFIQRGTVFLDRGLEKALALETDLPNALSAFEEALTYNPQSEALAVYIQETRIAIKERKERFDATISLIAKGQSVREEAKKTADIDKNYGSAIRMFRLAVGFFEAVDNEFSNLETQASSALSQLNRDINGTVSEVLDEATDTMDGGRQAEARNEYDDAIRRYELVEPIVSVIPEDINTSVTDNKSTMISDALKKVEEAKINKVWWEQQQEQLQLQAAQGGAPRQAANAATAGGGQPAAQGGRPGAGQRGSGRRPGPPGR
jgi:tetratricopeptide (TPR) repeat protein